MGVVLNEKPLNVKTGELNYWISKVKVKQQNFKRQKRKNLLVEAVLSNALVTAENLLRLKQQERRMRWQRVKPKLAEAPAILDTTDYCEELNSLNDFMSKLNSIKAPVQRQLYLFNCFIHY